MRCALYCRVSTTDQNCEMQLRELQDYVSRRDWKSSGEYMDTGFSVAKASRTALDRLMSDAAEREFDHRRVQEFAGANHLLFRTMQ